MARKWTEGQSICPDPIILLHLFAAIGTAKEHTLINKAISKWNTVFLPTPFTSCIMSFDFCPNHPKPQWLKAAQLCHRSQLGQVGWLVALGPDELGPRWLHLVASGQRCCGCVMRRLGAGLWHASLRPCTLWPLWGSWG